LATYFDALRIDHILGFFRIWSIPMNQATGTLGLFYPRMPVKIDELARFGVKGDLMRFTKPYIRTYMLMQQFETMSQDVIDTFLVEVYPDAYVFKSEFDTQMKVLSAVEDITLERFQPVVSKIIALHTEVLLIEEPNGDNLSFNPRITLHTTYSYRDLDDYTKRAFDNLYNHYFYQRHNEFWKNQAYWKLPALVKATNMLICGEDLGMIPATVPEVMTNLNIIPLEIQRMPKGETLFGNCKEYSYHTVCSPSCHDMSTIRGWWEGNIQTARNFYRLYMGFDYDPPRTCTTGLVEFINQDHLDSKSMLAIFPLQDLLGMDADLRLENPFAEQINEPSNPKHYWRYRLHLNLEQIIESKSIISLVKEMVKKSGRG
jgi:4-alpha-glucanotransferase